MEPANHYLKPITLDSSTVASLHLSIGLTFSEYFNMGCEFGPIVRGRRTSETADLSGVVTIFQKDFQGTMSLGFPKDLVFQLMTKIYKKEFTSIEARIIDGVGEITNSIYGQLRMHLNNQGHSLQMTIPTVVIGPGHLISPYTDKPTLILPVLTPVGNFHAAVVLETYPRLKGE